MRKGAIFSIHSIAGLVSGLFILLLSISGAALVFHDELDRLQQPKITDQHHAPVLSIDSIYSCLQKNYPYAQVSSCNLPESNSRPFVFTVYDTTYKKGNEPMQVFLHPQTSEVLKTRGGSNDIRNNFMSWLSAFHNSFHLHKKGEWLLGIFAIVFLISILTGLFLFRKNIVAVLLFKKTVFKKTNLHQLIGVYALIFNLMIAVTGFWMQRYVFKKEFYASYDYTPVIKASPPLGFRMDSVFINIQRTYPDFTGYVIYFAQSNKGKTAIYGSRKRNAFIHSKKFADVIALDSSGTISNTRFINEISADDRYDIINSQIHMGKFGGLPVKIIYSLMGLMCGLLSITGFLLWLKRK